MLGDIKIVKGITYIPVTGSRLNTDNACAGCDLFKNTKCFLDTSDSCTIHYTKIYKKSLKIILTKL